MRKYYSWNPGDPSGLAEWIDNEIATGAFDEAIAENIEDKPRDFKDAIEAVIESGAFDDAVIKRAETLGYMEAE